MITQSGSKRHTPSPAYVATNTLIWAIYAALVLLATQIFSFHTLVAVVVTTLAAAVVLNPLRRRAAHAAKQRFNHR